MLLTGRKAQPRPQLVTACNRRCNANLGRHRLSSEQHLVDRGAAAQRAVAKYVRPDPNCGWDLPDAQAG